MASNHGTVFVWNDVLMWHHVPEPFNYHRLVPCPMSLARFTFSWKTSTSATGAWLAVQCSFASVSFASWCAFLPWIATHGAFTIGTTSKASRLFKRMAFLVCQFITGHPPMQVSTTKLWPFETLTLPGDHRLCLHKQDPNLWDLWPNRIPLRLPMLLYTWSGYNASWENVKCRMRGYNILHVCPVSMWVSVLLRVWWKNWWWWWWMNDEWMICTFFFWLRSTNDTLNIQHWAEQNTLSENTTSMSNRSNASMLLKQ